MLYKKTLVVKNLTDLVEKSFNEYANDSDRVINSTMHVYYDAKSPFTFCDVAENYNNRPLKSAMMATTNTTTSKPTATTTMSPSSLSTLTTATSSVLLANTSSTLVVTGRKQRHLTVNSLDDYFDMDDDDQGEDVEMEFTMKPFISREENEKNNMQHALFHDVLDNKQQQERRQISVRDVNPKAVPSTQTV